MKWHRFFLTVAAILLFCRRNEAPRGPKRRQRTSIATPATSISRQRRGGTKTKLTASEMDVDPVLAPNGAYVVYTRQGRGRTVHGYDTSQVCATEPRPDELRQINADGSGDKLLLRGRKGGPETQLCDFRQKQFSSDGRRLYFLTPGWATSGALHVFDTHSGDDRFVMPANDVLVLEFLPEQIQGRSRRAGAPLFPARRQLRLVLALRSDG